jgi:hypothetical protein
MGPRGGRLLLTRELGGRGFSSEPHASKLPRPNSPAPPASLLWQSLIAASTLPDNDTLHYDNALSPVSAVTRASRELYVA